MTHIIQWLAGLPVWALGTAFLIAACAVMRLSSECRHLRRDLDALYDHWDEQDARKEATP